MSIHAFTGDEKSAAAVLARALTEAKHDDAVFVMTVQGDGTVVSLSSKFKTSELAAASVTLQAYAIQHALKSAE